MDKEHINNSSYTETQDLQTTDAEDKIENSTEEYEKSPLIKDVQDKDYRENIISEDLHNEILKKLDIINDEKNNSQAKSELEKTKFNENLGKIKTSESLVENNQLKLNLKQDFNKIQLLMNAGLINSAQGQNLKKEVLKKTFDKLVQTEKIRRNLTKLSVSNNIPLNKSSITNGIQEFNNENPSFFDTEGRKEVLNYLTSANIKLGKDEVKKISDIIRSIEKIAINRYLQKTTHEKNLKESNETAKQKLKANAQKNGINTNFSRTFTREQIGNMSGAEFAKYESVIMDQLKKGQIR